MSSLYRQSNPAPNLRGPIYKEIRVAVITSLSSQFTMLHKSRHAIKTVDIPYWHTRSEDGVVLPAFLDQDKIVEIRQRKIQTDDVFVASFPKSGLLSTFPHVVSHGFPFKLNFTIMKMQGL